MECQHNEECNYTVINFLNYINYHKLYQKWKYIKINSIYNNVCSIWIDWNQIYKNQNGYNNHTSILIECLMCSYMKIDTLKNHMINNKCEICDPIIKKKKNKSDENKILEKFKRYKQYLVDHDTFPKNNDESIKDLWSFGLTIVSSLKGLKDYYKKHLLRFKCEIEAIVYKSENLTNEWNLFMSYRGCRNCVMCNKTPSFNYPSWGTFALYCTEHKLDGMEDIKNNICKANKCKIHANYNFEGTGRADFCSLHKQPGMISINNQECEHPGCSTRASFNFNNEKNRRFCKQHKLDGMVGKCHKKCEFPKCSISASFNYPGQKGKFCGSHKLEGMINLNAKLCNFEGCEITANYNYPGEKRKFCTAHKTDGMIDVNNNLCEFQGCSLHPCFNFENENRGRFCSYHKLNNMINVVSPRCQYPQCNIIASYKFPYDKGLKFCAEHKQNGMINRDKKCEFLECKNRASFNYQNEDGGRFCACHKLDNMIDKSSNLCECCSTRAIYNFIGEKKGRFCNFHKINGMINIKDKRCQHPDCELLACYGDLYERKKYCSRHAELYKAFKVATCENENCHSIALYNNINVYPALRCEQHKLDDDIALFEEKCTSCNLDMLLDKNKLCSYCNINLKRVETDVSNYIRSKFPNNFISNDKVISDGCSRKRPDIILDAGRYYIIIEVDEHQHKTYNEECEYKRMFQIHQDFSQPEVGILFIRFNPDSYKINNKRINPKLSTRLLELEKYIYTIYRTYEQSGLSSLRVCYMYYDNYSGIPSSEELKYSLLGYEY